RTSEHVGHQSHRSCRCCCHSFLVTGSSFGRRFTAFISMYLRNSFCTRRVLCVCHIQGMCKTLPDSCPLCLFGVRMPLHLFCVASRCRLRLQLATPFRQTSYLSHPTTSTRGSRESVK